MHWVSSGGLDHYRFEIAAICPSCFHLFGRNEYYPHNIVLTRLISLHHSFLVGSGCQLVLVLRNSLFVQVLGCIVVEEVHKVVVIALKATFDLVVIKKRTAISGSIELKSGLEPSLSTRLH